MIRKLNRRTFLTWLARLGAGAGMTSIGLFGQGCDKDLASTVVGMIEHSDSIGNVWKSGSSSLEKFTPEHEYYIGRTIGAVILKKYRPYTKTTPTRYLNLVGQTLARFSEMPYLFDGYHFLILDSNEINAFATPSGLVFVTRGMIQCCSNEEMLAAVLAHEISHIQNRHGMKAIEKGRVTKVLSTMAEESVRVFGSEDLADLTDSFEETIDDIVTTMVNNGYSRDFEKTADTGAVKILKRTGYPPAALVEMLKRMEMRLLSGRPDFASTHPPPESRIATLRKLVGKEPHLTGKSRYNRFRAAMSGV